MKRPPSTGAFTLIELLVVIAIIAILAVVVVLTLNPAALLQQSRDSNRVSDMATLTDALNLYSSDQGGLGNLGNASSVYLSVPDPSATSTLGDQCQGLGMPSSTNYAYHCAASSTYRNTNGTGWIPVNFQNITSGSPFGNLPTDPANQTSTNLYYTYETNGTQFAVTSFLESSKYAKSMDTSGGIDPALYEQGSGVNILPDLGRGLIGYWPLNEGMGSTTIDWSGNNASGTWAGTATGTAGTYYAPGKTSQWAGDFDGATDYVPVPRLFLTTSTSYTISFWSYRTDTSGYHAVIGQNNFPRLQFNGTTLYMNTFSPDTPATPTLPSNTNVWEFWTVLVTPNSVTFYKNGQNAGTTSGAASFGSGSTTIGIAAASTNYFMGYINDLRVYARALSAAEIQEMYNAEK